jgi:hypothetical protein
MTQQPVQVPEAEPASVGHASHSDASRWAGPVERLLPTVQVACVDSRRQWSRFGYIRYDVGMRNLLHVAGAPVRGCCVPSRAAADPWRQLAQTRSDRGLGW